MNDKIGKLVRIEWNQENDEMQIIIEITNSTFKKRILHNKDIQDILTIKGQDVMLVASKSKNINDK